MGVIDETGACDRLSIVIVIGVSAGNGWER
jgi:hypothetical protein